MFKLLSLIASLSFVSAIPVDWSDTPKCGEHNIHVRKDFDTMEPYERKAYTDAINCMRDQPSQLDQNEFPGAINKYFDYATIHIQRTRRVHLNGFFLVWHRFFLHTFEQDLRETCGYEGAFPYWNWPATADNLRGSKIFNGDEFSMSGDGYPNGNDSIILSPTLQIPHGSGGGCIMSGPFKGMNYTTPPISNAFLINGTEPPESLYARKDACLTRDLNEYAAKTWCNETAVEIAVAEPNLGVFEDLINGVIGGGKLGIHSGAHFIAGNPAANIFVSAQDPIWYPLHTMLDRVYTSWQARHPENAEDTFGTETALNLPPSANVTLDSVLPDIGYLMPNPPTVGEVISTTDGPFCYRYDTLI